MLRTRALFLFLFLFLLWGCASPREGPDSPSNQAELASLTSLLRPGEGPLPSRSYLDGHYGAPVELLLHVATSADSDLLLRSNALRELGLFPDSPTAMAKLVELANDKAAMRPDRIGALSGLAQPDARDNALDRSLLPLLDDSDPVVQGASVQLLASCPEALPRIKDLAEDPATDAEVRRLAELVLQEAGRESPEP